MSGQQEIGSRCRQRRRPTSARTASSLEGTLDHPTVFSTTDFRKAATVDPTNHRCCEDSLNPSGGQVEADWESSSLRRYSSLDSSLLAELIGDVAWSNEGLFALLQGLRRLSRIGGHRVNLPTIDWEIRS